SIKVGDQNEIQELTTHSRQQGVADARGTAPAGTGGSRQKSHVLGLDEIEQTLKHTTLKTCLAVSQCGRHRLGYRRYTHSSSSSSAAAASSSSCSSSTAAFGQILGDRFEELLHKADEISGILIGLSRKGWVLFECIQTEFQTQRRGS